MTKNSINQNYTIVDFKDTKNLADDELANIEGPRAKLFLMFADWQPTQWALNERNALWRDTDYKR